MEDVLEVLEKAQNYCKDQPWCGCILGRLAGIRRKKNGTVD